MGWNLAIKGSKKDIAPVTGQSSMTTTSTSPLSTADPFSESANVEHYLDTGVAELLDCNSLRRQQYVKIIHKYKPGGCLQLTDFARNFKKE